MLKEIYTAALGMLSQQTRLEVTANNIANANTSGFKKESVFEKNLIEAEQNLNNIQGSAETNDSPIGSYTDFSTGAFQQTSNKLDFAIENPNGFFVVQDERGNEFLTRNGHFQISTDGNVITMDGKMLLGMSGAVNVINQAAVGPDAAYNTRELNIKLDHNGKISANDNVLDTLKVVRVDDLSILKRVSDTQFVENSTFIKSPAFNPEELSVRQGWLENSNVEIIREMVNMMELQKNYELNSKVIRTNDETLDISLRMGRFT